MKILKKKEKKSAYFSPFVLKGPGSCSLNLKNILTIYEKKIKKLI
jgi:hypothetical protein